MTQDTHVEKRWTRWHSDDWTAIVIRTTTGEWRYNAWHGPPSDEMTTAPSLVAAQHAAENIIRHSGHRCTARCSFWVPDTHEEP